MTLEDLDKRVAVQNQQFCDFLKYQDERNEKADKILEELRFAVLPLVEKVKANTNEIREHRKNHWQWFTASLTIAGLAGGVIGFLKGKHGP